MLKSLRNHHTSNSCAQVLQKLQVGQYFNRIKNIAQNIQIEAYLHPKNLLTKKMREAFESLGITESTDADIHWSSTLQLKKKVNPIQKTKFRNNLINFRFPLKKEYKLQTLSVSASLMMRTWRLFLRRTLRYSLLSLRGLIIISSSGLITPKAMLFLIQLCKFSRLQSIG